MREEEKIEADPGEGKQRNRVINEEEHRGERRGE